MNCMEMDGRIFTIYCGVRFEIRGIPCWLELDYSQYVTLLGECYNLRNNDHYQIQFV